MNPLWAAKKGWLGCNRKITELPLGKLTVVDKLFSTQQPNPNPFKGETMAGIVIPAGRLGTPYPHLFGDNPPFVVRYIELSGSKAFFISTENVDLYFQWIESNPEKKKKVNRAIAAVEESLF